MSDNIIALEPPNPDREKALKVATERLQALIRRPEFIDIVARHLPNHLYNAEPELSPAGAAVGCTIVFTGVDKIETCKVHHEISLSVVMTEEAIVEPGGSGIILPGEITPASLIDGIVPGRLH